MHYYHKFALIGFVIGVFPIISGIIALTTVAWIVINQNQSAHRIDYGLFQKCETNDTNQCTVIDSFQTSQYLEIIGYTILIVGLFAGVLCTALISKRCIHFIAPIILLMGTMTILLGLIFYIKSIVENISEGANIKSHLGYSLILMIATCMSGCILSAYFSYSAGYMHRHILGTIEHY